MRSETLQNYNPASFDIAAHDAGLPQAAPVAFFPPPAPFHHGQLTQQPPIQGWAQNGIAPAPIAYTPAPSPNNSTVWGWHPIYGAFPAEQAIMPQTSFTSPAVTPQPPALLVRRVESKTGLGKKNAALQAENAELKAALATMHQKYAKLESENQSWQMHSMAQSADLTTLWIAIGSGSCPDPSTLQNSFPPVPDQA